MAETPNVLIQIPVAHAAGQEDLSDGQAIIAMDSCAQMMAARYDDKLGGFGSAPKFPRPAEMNLLLVQHLRAKAAGSKAEAGESLYRLYSKATTGCFAMIEASLQVLDLQPSVS